MGIGESRKKERHLRLCMDFSEKFSYYYFIFL